MQIALFFFYKILLNKQAEATATEGLGFEKIIFMLYVTKHSTCNGQVYLSTCLLTNTEAN